MKQIARVLTLSAVIVCFGTCVATAQKPDTYKELVTKLKAGDTKIDFKAIRIASLDSEEKDAGEADKELRRKATEALNAKKFKEAMKAGEEALKGGYLDIDTHLIMALAARGAGDKAKFEFHQAVYVGLINSILGSGDGKSTKTAYVVINVGEEYSVLTALELKRGSQAVLDEGGHKYDVLTATDPKTNESEKVYFNIDAVWKGYEKVFKKN